MGRQHHQAAEREIDMRHSKKINILFALITVIAISGCYTQLMTPQDYIKIRRQQSSTPIANNTYSINYNQSCTSCHSVAELNERADELEYYGVRTVHDGVLLSSHQWLTEGPGNIPYGDPGPIYWPTPIYPTYPWWVPPVTVITNPTTPNKGNIIRTDGPTRDDKSDGGRDRPIPAPTYTQPSVPVGGTSSTPVVTAPAPAVIITPSPTSTPASQPTESGRTRDTNSEGGTTTTKTRSEGSSRDSAGSRPR